MDKIVIDKINVNGNFYCIGPANSPVTTFGKQKKQNKLKPQLKNISEKRRRELAQVRAYAEMRQQKQAAERKCAQMRATKARAKRRKEVQSWGAPPRLLMITAAADKPHEKMEVSECKAATKSGDKTKRIEESRKGSNISSSLRR
ncbi:hypothetical protein TYRP_011463 [Tyrophagus putrescentiae]|nr:hypothetical protein TYRP_011463 [Tyrophagus putrescentiae]